jgi:hypothetical protein
MSEFVVSSDRRIARGSRCSVLAVVGGAAASVHCLAPLALAAARLAGLGNHDLARHRRQELPSYRSSPQLPYSKQQLPSTKLHKHSASPLSIQTDQPLAERSSRN